MNYSRGLLYPALHKFYSALSSLENFEKGTNFFDNIGYLDSFLSEYRNITFVLQKSLASTRFTHTYEKLRDQYLVNDVGRWFIDRRNSVLKQQPFDLEKKIVINIYSGRRTLSLPELIFTIDNDVEFSTIIDSLRTTLMSMEQLEVMFSVEFSFYERGQSEDLYENFISGINQMKLFLSGMKMEVDEECKLSDELEGKIRNLNFYRVPKDFLFVDDYIFYRKKMYFEKASRIAVRTGQVGQRVPLENFNKSYPSGDIFHKFELMHLVIFQMQKTLLPTCLVGYSDDTFEFVTFGFTVKTTVYRKFHEIAGRIRADGISTILFVTEMFLSDTNDLNNLHSKERLKHEKKEIIAFFMIDKHLTIRSHGFDSKLVDDFKYIKSIMSTRSNQLGLPRFMNPIIQEFERLKTNF